MLQSSKNIADWWAKFEKLQLAFREAAQTIWGDAPLRDPASKAFIKRFSSAVRRCCMPYTEHGLVLQWLARLVAISGLRCEQSDLKAMTTSHAAIGVVLHDLHCPVNFVCWPEVFRVHDVSFHTNEAF